MLEESQDGKVQEEEHMFLISFGFRWKREWRAWRQKHSVAERFTKIKQQRQTLREDERGRRGEVSWQMNRHCV